MGGHATHDEADARSMLPAALYRYWGERDPIGTYETWLVGSRIDLGAGLAALGLPDGELPADGSERNRAALERIAASVQAEVEAAAEEALQSRAHAMPDGHDVGADLFAEPEA
jgi:hypothetical protein